MSNAATLGQLDQVFTQTISVALALVGVTSLVMILVGGFHYLNAGGNKEATSKAHLTLTYAFLGLILAVSGWAILNILGNFLGLDLGTFSICAPGFSGPNCTP